MVTQQDVLAQIATLSTGVDTLISQASANDLQPVADALTAIQTKVTAATAPATPPAA